MIPFGKHLNINSRTKNPTDKDLFTEVVGLIDECWIRSNVIEGEFGLGILNYDEPFYLVFENLIYMHYGEWKGDIMLWWLFERFNEDGSILPSIRSNNAKSFLGLPLLKNLGMPLPHWFLCCSNRFR